MTELGRLERVELRNIWQSEAQHFTPWLAREDNLALLADTLGIDLELEAVERNVGPFRADILCKDTISDSWVLIENQLERTDHTHLGQLMTYAAGLNAVTIVWIAARIADEHRAAMDWLNDITTSDVQFFALEVELWRIGDSPAAPKFNVVSKPNDWSRSLSGAKRVIGDISETQQFYLDYWTAFEEVLQDRSRRVRAVKAQPQNWMVHGLGKTGVNLNCTLNRKENSLRAEVYLTGQNAHAHYAELKESIEAIEGELGLPLDWYAAEKDRRISCSRAFQDVTEQAHWPEQHAWLADMLDRFHRVFAPRVTRLDAVSWLAQQGARSGHET